MALFTNIFWGYTLAELLDTILLDFDKMWIMHVGAPAHFSYATRNYLETARRQGPVSWASCSPGPHPLNLFFLEHLKVWCMLQWWLPQRNYCSRFKMDVPQLPTLPAFFGKFVNPCIIRTKAVWQCKANILNAYCNPNNNCHLSLERKTTLSVSCCIICWTEFFCW
jgi:hypothetical protein